jgi:hypothetical protein
LWAHLFLPNVLHRRIGMVLPSKITRTFCPTLDLGSMTFSQTIATVMWYALGVVAAPRRSAPGTFGIELEHLLGWTVILEQLGPHPFAEVLNLLCFLIRRRA